jgi:hypothetical protein
MRCNKFALLLVEDDIVVSTLAAVFPPEPVLALGNATYQVRRLPRLLYRQVIFWRQNLKIPAKCAACRGCSIVR